MYKINLTYLSFCMILATTSLAQAMQSKASNTIPLIGGMFNERRDAQQISPWFLSVSKMQGLPLVGNTFCKRREAGDLIVYIPIPAKLPKIESVADNPQ